MASDRIGFLISVCFIFKFVSVGSKYIVNRVVTALRYPASFPTYG